MCLYLIREHFQKRHYETSREVDWTLVEVSQFHFYQCSFRLLSVRESEEQVYCPFSRCLLVGVSTMSVVVYKSTLGDDLVRESFDDASEGLIGVNNGVAI